MFQQNAPKIKRVVSGLNVMSVDQIWCQFVAELVHIV